MIKFVIDLIIFAFWCPLDAGARYLFTHSFFCHLTFLLGLMHHNFTPLHGYHFLKDVLSLCNFISHNDQTWKRLFLIEVYFSKTDIFSIGIGTRFMNSHMSLSHLDGFFLRIRLGKWEEGLGGTGYHVACIRGKMPINTIMKSSLIPCLTFTVILVHRLD